MNNIISCSQIQAQASGLETDQKQIPITALESLYLTLTLLGRSRPIQVLIMYPFVIKIFADQGQVPGELTENQSLVSSPQQLLHHLGKNPQLG